MTLNRDNFVRITIFIVVLLLCSLAIVRLLYGVLSSMNVEIPWWFETPSVLGVMAVLYGWFDRRAWRWAMFRKVRLIQVPDLSGRWKGTIVSSYHDHQQETPAVLEIHQTSSRILVSMYLQSSRSKSLMATFVHREDGQIELHYEYESLPEPNAAQAMHIHFGTAQLRYHETDDALEGAYYTSARDRATYGTIRFRREGKTCMGRFE